MKKINYLFLGIFLILGLASCSEELNITEDLSLLSVEESTSALLVAETVSPYCGTLDYPIWAGQHTNAGTMIISNDETNLYVTVNSTEGFQDKAENIKMWLGTDLSTLDGGGIDRPSAGSFPYKATVAPGEKTYTFTIPLANIPIYDASKCGVQAIYAVVHIDILAPDGNGGSTAETAFGGDSGGTGKSWWFYSVYTPACCETPPPPPTSEKLGTAFAKGGYVFTTDRKSNPENLPTLGLTKNRWGWAINLTAAGSTSYDLYVGAGLNNTSKGKLVGSVTIDYTGTQATITYNLNSGFSIEEAHVYAGDFRPTTLAPGQYGNTNYFNPFAVTHSVTVDVTDTNNDGVWFIAHAVAYGPGVTNVN